MSDLFISEILSLSLLIPVLLRPFFRKLQRIEGIALLPLLSFLICLAIVGGNGLELSFLPVFLFSFLVFLSGLSRLFRLFLHLPTDWYSTLSVVYSVFLLILLAGAVCISWFFAPEDAYRSSVLVQRTAFIRQVSPGVSARFTIVKPTEIKGQAEKLPVVLMTGNITALSGSRNTLSWLLAENGYTVVEADFRSTFDYKNPLLYFPSLRKFFTLAGKIATGSVWFTDDNEILQAETKELTRLLQFVHDEYGQSIVLYAVAEGSSGRVLLKETAANPDLFSGAVWIAEKKETVNLPNAAAGSLLVTLDSGMMVAQAGAYPLMVLTGSDSLLPGYGELAADDVLAAVLMGASRDTGRKNAELTSRRILTWLSMRKIYDVK